MAVAARRECVRQLQDKGLSERQACRLVGISTSVLRYQARPDGSQFLRERLKQLAGQHRRHGYRMLHNRLRNEGWVVNVKRTYRLYRQEGLIGAPAPAQEATRARASTLGTAASRQRGMEHGLCIR
jgi:putative transposase